MANDFTERAENIHKEWEEALDTINKNKEECERSHKRCEELHSEIEDILARL